jgi:hypothetical protein
MKLLKIKSTRNLLSHLFHNIILYQKTADICIGNCTGTEIETASSLVNKNLFALATQGRIPQPLYLRKLHCTEFWKRV